MGRQWGWLVIVAAIVALGAWGWEAGAQQAGKGEAKEAAKAKAKAKSDRPLNPDEEIRRLGVIRVESGGVERIDAPVSVELPGTIQAWRVMRLVEVRGGQRVAAPMQIEAGTGGKAAKLWFTLSGSTAANTKREFELWNDEPVFGGGVVGLSLNERTLDVTHGGRPVFSYNHAHVAAPEGVKRSYTASGYIHPLRSPSGMLLTEDFPSDHYHHKGIWMPWTYTEYEGRKIDFWNLGGNSGRWQHAGFGGMSVGPVYGGFKVKHEHVDVTQPNRGLVILEEEWDVRLWAGSGAGSGEWTLDLMSSQRNVTDKPLVLPEYRYGGIGWRGAKEWKDENYVVLTSEGKEKADGHATTARWSAHSGSIEGKWCTVVVMSHPRNFRHPEPQRIWPKNGAFFNYAPSQAGEWSIEPGREYEWRYRFFVHEGVIDAVKAERAWREYAEPVRARFEGE